jgi:hypothetical protein
VPLYFFHFHDGQDWLIDREGVELADAVAVSAVALVQGRDIMAGDIKDGRIDLPHLIEIVDERGCPVHRLNFTDAITLAWPKEDCASPRLHVHQRQSLTGEGA